MFIPMKKIYETSEGVRYEISLSRSGEKYINEKGRERYQVIFEKGVIEFDKNSEKIQYVSKETSIYLLKDTCFLAACSYIMKLCKEKNEYPAETCYASG